MATFTPSEMQRLVVPTASTLTFGERRSAHPFKVAAAAASLAMLADIPLAKKFPLHDESVSLPTRIAVTGGLVFVSVLLAAQFIKE